MDTTKMEDDELIAALKVSAKDDSPKASAPAIPTEEATWAKPQSTELPAASKSQPMEKAPEEPPKTQEPIAKTASTVSFKEQPAPVASKEREPPNGDFGDPGAKTLYKDRREPKPVVAVAHRDTIPGLKITKPQLFAFVNVFFAFIDMMFSVVELIVWTSDLSDYLFKESVVNNRVHWTFLLISSILHGDCVETTVEMGINFIGECFYVFSSMFFAYATTLRGQDRSTARVCTQWYTCSMWVPVFCLLPRFPLNLISYCDRHVAYLFDHQDHHTAALLFWVVNVSHVICLCLWLYHGKNQAGKFIAQLDREEEELFARKNNLLSMESSLALQKERGKSTLEQVLSPNAGVV